MKILHLIRRTRDGYPFAILNEQAKNPQDALSVVYLHDAAVRGKAIEGALAFALAEDVEARGVAPTLPTISYAELLDLIFASDRVISW